MRTAPATGPASTCPADRPRLAVVGAGRCGTALATAAAAAGYPVVAVTSRTPAHARTLARRVGAAWVPTAVAAVRAADITFLTVPDEAIARVAATVAATGMALRGRGLVHCSGAAGRSALAAARLGGASLGAVHPLQALVDARSARGLRGSFFAVDADEELRGPLEELVTAVGGVPFEAPIADRALYHAAAVLAGNAPLALLARAVGLLERAGVDSAVAAAALAALLEGAARNARRLGPRAALTGPVVRDDAATVRRHLEVLAADPATEQLYRRMAVETLAAVGTTGREQVAAILAAPGTPPRRLPRRRRLGLGGRRLRPARA